MGTSRALSYRGVGMGLQVLEPLEGLQLLLGLLLRLDLVLQPEQQVLHLLLVLTDLLRLLLPRVPVREVPDGRQGLDL